MGGVFSRLCFVNDFSYSVVVFVSLFSSLVLETQQETFNQHFKLGFVKYGRVLRTGERFSYKMLNQ